MPNNPSPGPHWPNRKYDARFGAPDTPDEDYEVLVKSGESSFNAAKDILETVSEATIEVNRFVELADNGPEGAAITSFYLRFNEENEPDSVADITDAIRSALAASDDIDWFEIVDGDSEGFAVDIPDFRP